jgi:raffinose/stachyose/melibiose transport system substrate-binding protein
MKHKLTKPIITVAVTALAVSLLAGCGNSGGVGGQKSAAQNASGSVTLNYWTWYPDQKTTQAAIAGFEKANPNIKVNLRLYTNTDYQKDLPLALNGGSKLDVVGVQVSAMTNTVKSNLRPVSTYANDLVPGWKTQLDPKLVKQTQAAASDDVLYDLPMGEVSSPFVFYNAALLKKYDIAVPKTADQLAAASKKLVAAGISQPVVEVGDGWWQEEVLFGIIGQTNPTLSDKIFLGKASWNQPAIVKGLADYKSLFDSGAIATSTLSLTGSAPDAAFDTGKAAFLIGGAWESSILSASYRAANNIALSDVGATSFPIVESGGKPAARSLAEGGLAIPKSSTHVAAAAKFISYMTYGAGVGLWDSNLVYAPAAKVGFAPTSELTTAAAKKGFATVVAVSSAPGSERTSQQDFLNNVEGPTILNVLRGTTTPEAAAASLQAAWTSGRYPHSGN